MSNYAKGVLLRLSRIIWPITLYIVCTVLVMDILNYGLAVATLTIWGVFLVQLALEGFGAAVVCYVFDRDFEAYMSKYCMCMWRMPDLLKTIYRRREEHRQLRLQATKEELRALDEFLKKEGVL